MLSGNTYAQKLMPNNVDLRAAYCISSGNAIVNLLTSIVGSSPTEPLSKEAKKLIESLHEERNKLKRMQGYLIPRLEYLATEPLMIASNQFGRGIGEQKLKLILNTESTILTSEESLEEKYEKLIRIKGIGIENAKSFTENFSKFLEFLRECGLERKLVSTPTPIQNTIRLIDIDTSHPLYGKRIVMTNIRDANIKEKLEKVGGILDDKISKNTFLLIVKSKQDETSKSKYAKEHNIEIMEPEEFLSRFFKFH
jgi:hypothetical protein